MRKMTTQEYILENGVKEIFIIGRPKLPDTIQEEYEMLKKSISDYTDISQTTALESFAQKNSEEVIGIYFYKVNLITKKIVDEILVSIEKVEDFIDSKILGNENIIFTDLHFNNINN